MTDKYVIGYIFIFAITFITTVLLEKALIPKLSAYAKQPIYEEGPKWHISKKGTPTMGGIAFLVAIALSLLTSVALLAGDGDPDAAVSVAITLLYAVFNAFIGVVDDVTKLKRKQNGGLTPKQKLFLQLLCAIAFVAARKYLLGDTTAIYFSFGSVDLGLFYYPLAITVLLGTVNCANLTDGIDGLASSVAFAISLSLFYISFALSKDTAFIASAMAGGALGFIVYNIHPARIFMGDTGSLFLGALAASAVFSLSNPILIIAIGGVYVVEGISVIVQVICYKLTGKRILKMAPIHHHLERCGFDENKICIIAMIFTFVSSAPAFLSYL